MSEMIYFLSHVVDVPNGSDIVRYVGVYASKLDAEAGQARASKLPGFDENLNGFFVDAYRLDEDHWTSGFGDAS